jgi:hypothetical protein
MAQTIPVGYPRAFLVDASHVDALGSTTRSYTAIDDA